MLYLCCDIFLASRSDPLAESVRALARDSEWAINPGSNTSGLLVPGRYSSNKSKAVQSLASIRKLNSALSIYLVFLHLTTFERRISAPLQFFVFGCTAKDTDLFPHLNVNINTSDFMLFVRKSPYIFIGNEQERCM